MFEDLGAEGIRLNDNGRSVFLKEWSRMKQKKQRIASDKASVSQGVFPHIQAQRFAAFLRQEEPFRIVIEAPKP